MGSALIYGKEKMDIGVPVITFEDPGAPSFYYPPKGRAHMSIINPEWEGIKGSRKDKVNKVVIHHDGMPTSLGCFQVLVQRMLSTHLMVDEDGKVYQPADLRDITYHGGEVNPESVGLDMCQPVRPERCRCEPSMRGGLFRGEINGGRVVSLGYTDAQYEALIAVLNGLCKIFPNIRRLAPIGPDGRVLRQKLVNINFSGVVGHQHVSANKWDPGPGFDWERVLIGLRGTPLWYALDLKGVPNLATVPKRHALLEAEPYFRNTESGDGGFFPVGVNQAWHTGIHLHPESPGQPVRAPADGVVVVARQTDDDGPFGSPNVVVIKHEFEHAGNKKTCFSVLGHLRRELLGRTSEVPWIRRLFLRDDGPNTLPDEDADHPPSAPGAIALVNGRAALLEVEVKAGETVGHVGTFAGDGGSPKPLLEFALIAGEPIIDPSDTSFEIVDEDEGEDVLCNARAVWKRIIRRPLDLRGLVDGGYPLAPSEVRDYFNLDKSAAAMRWLVPRHVTEWSDKTDFSGLFGGGVDFDWSARKAAERYLARIRQYLWWDENVTTHTGLPADRRVYSYHPITLLAFLARGEARKALRPGEEGPEKALEGEALARARREDAAYEAENKTDTGCDLVGIRDLEGEHELDEAGADDPEREGWMRWEQGEWEAD